MISLLEAIKTYYAAAGTPLSSVTGPWLDIAGDAKAYPYCVMEDGGGPVDYSMDSRFIQDVTITFAIYHTDFDQLGVFMKALDTRFTGSRPTVGDGICLSFKRKDGFRGFAGRDTNNKSVYVGKSMFRVQVQGSF